MIGLLFPGQGAQKVGMGKELFENRPWARDYYHTASDIVGWDVADLCFNGPKETLDQTRFCQPAIVVVSYVSFLAFRDDNPGVEYSVAGLSLGEFGALLAADVLAFEDVVRLVDLRGRLMQEASEEIPGAMTAVIGLDKERLEEICSKYGVELANFNAPGQIVISGGLEDIEAAEEEIKEAGARRVVRLPVSGAFHCSLLKDAQDRLNEVIDGLDFSNPSVDFFSSVSGTKLSTGEEIKQGLKRQLVSPTLWEPLVRQMCPVVSEFKELEPAGILMPMVRKICR